MPTVLPHPVAGNVLDPTQYGTHLDLSGHGLQSGKYFFYPASANALNTHGGHQDLLLTSAAQAALDANWDTWDVDPATTPDGMLVIFVSPGTNTGAVKLTVDNTNYDTRDLLKGASTALVAGDLVSGKIYVAVAISSSVWLLLNPSTESAIFVTGEDLTSQIDGITSTFTLANTPNPPSSLALYLYGLRQRLGVDYTLSGLTITWLGGVPVVGDVMLADYRR